MGLFQQRPEDPTEWAGIPSDPLRPASSAEQLDAVSAVDPAALRGGGATSSFSIPIEVPEVDGDGD